MCCLSRGRTDGRGARAGGRGVSWGTVCAMAVGAVLWVPGAAFGNGLELLPGGTRAAGRAGAVAARPTDPMAMVHNPAGLPRLSGDQVMLNLDLPRDYMCVQPYGYYGWGVYVSPISEPTSEFGDPTDQDGNGYPERLLDQVCNDVPLLPIPQIAWPFHLTESLSLGLGMVAPTLVAGLQYGPKDGTLATDEGPRPTPTRYQMLHQEVIFGLNPTVSVAYRFMDALSAGLTLHIGMAKANVYAVSTLYAGTQPSDDILSKVTAEDYFIPGITASLHSEPLPGLSLMASARIVDDFSGPGELTMTTNYYHQGAEGDNEAPHKNPPVRLQNITVGTPWAVTAAARYAYLRPGAEQVGREGGDPLATELFDIEVDVTLNLTERSDRNRVSVGDDINLQFRVADGTPSDMIKVSKEELQDFVSERHLKNSIALRLGGSFNPIPDLLGFSAGVFYESRGIEPAYASIESFAFRRLGVGMGAVVRLGSFDLLASYSHIFGEELEVAPPPHAPRSEGSADPTSGFDKRIYRDGELTEGPVEDPRAPDPDDADAVARFQQVAAASLADRRARVVNAGRYTASFDVFSVGVVYRY